MKVCLPEQHVAPQPADNHPDADSKSAGNKKSIVECSCVQNEGDIKAFLGCVLKNTELVDEAYQRTVVRAILSAESVCVATVRGWLFRIALNEARQLMREKRKQAPAEQELHETPVSYTGGRGVAEQQLLDSETIRVVTEAIRKLPEEYQAVLVRRLFGEKSFIDIAQELNAPIGSVLTWMRRGLIRLREDPGIRELL